MAQGIGNFIDRIQIGSDEAHQVVIGSSAYGVCSTAANEAAKTVNIPGFTLNLGTTIHIKFTNTNSVSSPTLNVSNTGAKSIMQYGTTNASTTAETTGWQAGAVLTLTYDGTNWIRDQGYNTNSQNAYGNITISGELGTASQAVVTDSNKKITTANLTVADPSVPSSGVTTSLSFIDTINQDAQGKISVTKKNVQVVSASQAGVAPKGEAVTTQNQNTKFLRSDGSWAVPSYTANTDAKVAQTGNTEDKEFSILLKNTNNTTDETAGVKYGKTTDKLVTINPSKGTISAPGGFIGNSSTTNKISHLKEESFTTASEGWFTVASYNSVSRTSRQDLLFAIQTIGGSASPTTCWIYLMLTWTVAAAVDAQFYGSNHYVKGVRLTKDNAKTYIEVKFGSQMNAALIIVPKSFIGTLTNNSYTWYSGELIASAEGRTIGSEYLHNGTSLTVQGSIKASSFDGNASSSSAANLTTTANAIAYYTNTTGTFGSKASTNGALYATSTNGSLQWGTLPIAQGGTGATVAADARNNLGLGSIATYAATAYVPFKGNLTSLGPDTSAAATKTYWTDNIDNNSVAVAYNSSGNEKTVIFSRGGSSNVGTVLKYGYTDTYIYILRQANGWNSTDWEKISAGYADYAAQLSFTNGRIASADLDISTMRSRMLLTLASSSMTTSKPPMGDGYIVTYGWDNAYWGAQQAISHTKTPHMTIRGTNGGSMNDWGDWIYLLDANNYTDYTVKKDGTGASGSWGISITGTAAKATADASGNTITSTYAPLASPALTGTPTAPTAANGTNTTQIATTAFVNNTLSYANAMRFKGTLGTDGTITALPASHEAGDTYRVITAGTWAGKYCEEGTLIICLADGTATSDTDWTSVETNEDGAVIGPTGSTNNAIVRWSGTSGRIIKDSSNVIVDDNGNTTIGNSSTASTLTVFGATTLNNTLSVTSTSTLTGKVGIGTDPDNATTGDIHILTIKGNTRILNSSSTIVAHIDTNTTSGSLVELYPHTTNTGYLGTSSHRWNALYLGTADTYGDPYLPIYWNDGVPATVTPIQYVTFTIASGKNGVKLSHVAFTNKSYVLQIVITSGESNLNSVITWSSETTGEISLTCGIVTSGAVHGYIIVSRGDALTATSTDIPPATPSQNPEPSGGNEDPSPVVPTPNPNDLDDDMNGNPL